VTHWPQVIAQSGLAVDILSWDFANKAAAIAGLVGIPLALLGLWFSFREAQKAKTASQAASRAVRRFRQDLNLINNVADFTRVLSIMEEIKRLLRGKALVPLPDRLSEMRKLLIAIRQNTPALSTEDQEVFQNAIVNFQTLEKTIDTHILNKTEPEDIASINEGVSLDIDALQKILSVIRSKIGTTAHDDS